MKLHIRIKSIEYKEMHVVGHNIIDTIGYCHKTKCIIRWINPITGNIQRSVGVAKCNPNDKNDIIKGQRIAESRAKINMWRIYNLSVVGILKDTLNRHFKFIGHEEQHLRDLINDVKTK